MIYPLLHIYRSLSFIPYADALVILVFISSLDFLQLLPKDFLCRGANFFLTCGPVTFLGYRLFLIDYFLNTE